ncbi:MAG: hypothetical protein U0325_36515, partial [Polyangiales bacterium]
MTGVVAIAAGDAHTCARLQSGELRCWGSNEFGQLGNGMTNSSNTPVAVTGLPMANPAVEIAAGGGHTCARLQNDDVYCWGEGGRDQLGAPDTQFMSTPVRSVCVRGCADNFPATDTGATTTCALTCVNIRTSNRHCGECDKPCLGRSTCVDGRCRPPASCETGQASCSPDGCVNLQTDPRHCGACTTACTAGQVCVGARCLSAGALQIAAGARHTCEIVTEGAVRCWGSNASGQRGDGPTPSGATCSGPDEIPMDGAAVEVAAGRNHTCARLQGGDVRCWGSNGSGQLGNGTTSREPARSPVTVTVLPGPTNPVVQLVAGSVHTCARLQNGAVRCWGANDSGQLGNASASPMSAADVTGLSDAMNPVVQIAAGSEHTCARLQNGEVWCWGHNNAGQLGSGTLEPHRAAVRVVVPPTTMGEMPTPLTGVVEIAAGAGHTCARRTGGDVWCWGSNVEGELGDGTTDSSPAAVQALCAGSTTGSTTCPTSRMCNGMCCAEALTCSTSGTCECASGTACGTPVACVDLQSDRYNCGGCGRACSTAQRCCAGMCVAPSGGECPSTTMRCPVGRTDCTPTTSTATCVDTTTSTMHCGACGRPCAVPMNGAATCTGGTCGITCNAGFHDCGGVCVSNSVTATCGAACTACSVPANATATCNGSACGFTCNAGFSDCDMSAANGCEVNTNTSMSNCGRCGTACSFANAAATCASGTCALGTCNAGFANCDTNPTNGCEASTSTDVANCGACGRSCPTAGMCVSGACQCPSGRMTCGGACVDLTNDST